ncbi:ribbon-helix-helix domain-containing protein [Inquilinus sp. CA228]|uniref:ribbon-helix-helix domain-containing protein n=1 Tax=Inquilinus sp. CA228 TaxID=3455609 RepID=UPI003F8D3F0B
MSATRWNLVVSQSTDIALRQFLASQGGGRKGDLSRFVEEAVRAHILELTAAQTKAANADVDQDTLDAAIDQALAATRR